LQVLDHIDPVLGQVREQGLEAGDHVIAVMAAIVDDDVEGTVLNGDALEERPVALVAPKDGDACLGQAGLVLDVQPDDPGAGEVLLPHPQ
jgi:hypothetical protein